MIDLHSHILPNIDDGAKDINMAVAMAKIAEEDGIEQMVATPHLFRGEYVYDDLNIINIKVDELRKALQEKSISLNILPGAEVHISHNQEEGWQNPLSPFLQDYLKKQTVVSCHHLSG